MSEIAASTLPFLEALAGIRTGFLTAILNGLTWLGDEKLFVLVSLVVFWCVDKRGGLYMLTVGFGVSNVGQALKMIFRVPRPWNLGEKPFENADPVARGSDVEGSAGGSSGIGKLIGKLLGSGADGWSFPSGHTLISVGTYGGMAAWFSRRWVKIIGIALAVIVPFSRLYLGVHTPVDIVCAAVIALLFVLLLKPVFARGGNGRIRAVLIGNAALSAVLLICMYLAAPKDLSGEDVVHYASGIKNLWQLLGACIAVVIAFEADERKTRFDPHAAWPAQLLKIGGGCVIVLAVQMGIQKALGYSSSELTMDNMTRMGIIACFANLAAMTCAMAVWPMAFRKIAELGRRDS